MPYFVLVKKTEAVSRVSYKIGVLLLLFFMGCVATTLGIVPIAVFCLGAAQR